MKKRTRIIEWLQTSPRRAVLYSGISGLILLLMMFTLNEKNWKLAGEKTSWTVSSNYSKAGAAFAIDNDLNTYWTSYVPATSGTFFQVDLGKALEINGILLNAGKREPAHPKEWVVKTSRDGHAWQAVITNKEIGYRAMFAIIFPKIEARYVQIIHTSLPNNRARWEISELDIFQPIVPWQFERSTIIAWIIGWLGVIAIALIGLPRTGQAFSLKNIVPPIVLLVLLVGGWGLRVYHLSGYEFSAREVEIFSLIDIDERDSGKWLSAYFAQHPKSTGWPGLFLIRLMYQNTHAFPMAMRLLPAIFSLFLILLLLLMWKGPFLSDVSRNYQHIFFERGILAGFVSFSGFQIFLVRNADFSVVFICLLLLYFTLAHRFFIQRGNYAWLPVLTLVFLGGFSLDVGFLVIPVGIGFFNVIRRFGFRHNRYSENLRSTRLRGGAYLLSTLPVYVYWLWSRGAEAHSLFFSSELFTDSLWRTVLQALRYSGIDGIALWFFGGIAVIGLIRIVVARVEQEEFFLFQSVFWLGSGLIMQKISLTLPSALLLSLLLTWGFARGFSLLITGLISNFSLKRIDNTGFSTGITYGCLLLFLGLLFIFSLNSFFRGNANAPYAAEVFAYEQHSHRLDIMLEQIVTAPGDCNDMAFIGERQEAEAYSVSYSPRVQNMSFPDIQRFAAAERFWKFLLVPFSAAESRLLSFLQQHYSRIGKGSHLAIYALESAVLPQGRRYSARQLYHKIGRFLDDQTAENSTALVARKGESAGFLTFGPYFEICTPGRYLARFALRADVPTDESEKVVARLKVVADTYTSLTKKVLTGSDFPDSGLYYTFDLPFEIDLQAHPAFSKTLIQLFVNFTGNAELRVDYVELLPVP